MNGKEKKWSVKRPICVSPTHSQQQPPENQVLRSSAQQKSALARFTFFAFALYVGLLPISLHAQKTVGLLHYDGTSSDAGYTLFTPMSYTQTYLIDNCGKLAHTWPSTYKPGCSAYLLADGSILRPGAVLNPKVTPPGGFGGIIERISWDGEIMWSYTVNSSTEIQHHDICPLPNGNVLILALDVHTKAEAVAMGRDTMANFYFYSEKIIEVKPTGPTTGDIVWQWRLWDHLVEESDSTKATYGKVAEHPELMNINAGTLPIGLPDWAHVNAISYNPERDEIVMSSHNFSEIWVIDHSTSMAEAASHSGGHHGRGGDFLYRWGNPMMYSRGTVEDQQLGLPHDVSWIPAGVPDAGKIMIFNNVASGVNSSTLYSSVDIIDPDRTDDGVYSLNEGRFGPALASWRYFGTPRDTFYASFMAGAQRLPNGHTFICNGPAGTMFEVDDQQNILWYYANPVNDKGPINQGVTPTNNSLFRATRYPLAYPAFKGHDMFPFDPIESNPSPDACVMSSVLNSPAPLVHATLQLSGSPASDQSWIQFSVPSAANVQLSVYDMNGRLLRTLYRQNADASVQYSLPLGALDHSGTYLLQLKTKEVLRSIPFIYINQ